MRIDEEKYLNELLEMGFKWDYASKSLYVDTIDYGRASPLEVKEYINDLIEKEGKLRRLDKMLQNEITSIRANKYQLQGIDRAWKRTLRSTGWGMLTDSSKIEHANISFNREIGRYGYVETITKDLLKQIDSAKRDAWMFLESSDETSPSSLRDHLSCPYCSAPIQPSENGCNYCGRNLHRY